MIERTRLGAYLRAATENPTLVRAFGINVPRMITLTYGFGVGAGGARRRDGGADLQRDPADGLRLIIVVFAVVVIGGMGSIMGAIVTGFGLGIVEGLTKVFFPEASNTVIFVIMVIVLLVRPAGPVRAERMNGTRSRPAVAAGTLRATRSSETVAFAVMVARAWSIAPFFIYPLFLMKVLCFALFACAFNLLIGYGGLLSFGHALYFGWASYCRAYAAKVWGLPPELAILAGTARRPCSAWSPARWRSAARASISR